MNRDLQILESHVYGVARKWFELARMHYIDASAVDSGANPRSVYSRAYYAAYNASKAVLSPSDCLDIAADFLKAAEQFLPAEYGLRV